MSDASIFDDIAGIDVADWLSHLGVRAKVSGADNINIQTCPACGNTNWKVRISKSKRLGYCFHANCEAKFTLFSFAKAYLGGSNHETLKSFEDYIGPGTYRPRSMATRPAIVVPDEWSLPASIPLPTPNGHTHPFLTQRRILPETQAAFGLRYCHEGSFTYQGARGLEIQRFNDRIILPVTDLDGHIKTFQGRATWQVDEEFEKRYLFPVGLPGSSHFLYGGHLVRGRKRLVMVEGPFDALATYQAIAGHPDYRDAGTVATFGLSLGHSDPQGDDQLGRLRKLMRDGLEEVTIIWDAEKNAYRSAIKAGLVMCGAGLKVRIGTLPPGCDPNEVETRVVRDAIANARELTRTSAALLIMTNPFA